MEIYEKIPLSKIEKIQLYNNTKKKSIATVKKETGADYAINGGIFSFITFKPFCNVKSEGAVLYKPNYSEYGFSWNTGSDIGYKVLPTSDKNYLGCVGMILNGTKQQMNYNSDMGGTRQRSAIGLDGSGNFIMYACNGSSNKTPEKLQSYCLNMGWKYGLMLDGGRSTSFLTNSKTLISEGTNGRIVSNYVLVFLKKTTTSNTTTTTTTATKTNPYTKPTRNLYLWSTGNDVKWLQYALNREGYNCGAVDGIFGSNTQKQVKAFQKAKGLDVDGIVGPKTREALV